MSLAEGVAAGNQRDGLFVVHRHAEKRFADVLGRRDRIRLAVRPFRIDVDQAHLHRTERILKLTFAAIALVAEPRSLRPPIELLGFPDIGATAAETKRLEAHRVQRDVAGENHQVGPGDFPAVLLLDRPQQPARFVEIGVVRPAVQRREALLPGAGAAAAVGDAVRARAVPRHADEQATIGSVPGSASEVGHAERPQPRSGKVCSQNSGMICVCCNRASGGALPGRRRSLSKRPAGPGAPARRPGKSYRKRPVRASSSRNRPRSSPRSGTSWLGEWPQHAVATQQDLQLILPARKSIHHLGRADLLARLAAEADLLVDQPMAASSPS